MPAVSSLFSHATAGFTIQLLRHLKVSCLSWVRPRRNYALDPHISDHVIMTKIASITLSNRSIKYNKYFVDCCRNWHPKILNGLHTSLSWYLSLN